MKKNIFDLSGGMELRKSGFIFIFFLDIIAFWAFIKYIVLHYLIRLDDDSIRNRFYGSFFVDRFSQVNRKMRLNARNWRPLDELYNYSNRLSSYKPMERVLSRIWMVTENAQAARNRARIVRKCVGDELKRKIEKNGSAKILSIASGSAQPLLEAVSFFSDEDQKKINITLLDLDKSALKNSANVAKKLKIKAKVDFKHNSAHDVADLFPRESLDIIEMVGFLDYRPDKNAIALNGNIRDLLKKGGLFLTCNIYLNKEKFFITWVLLWPMIYRSENEFKRIIYKAGFAENNVKIFFEPLKIHIMAACHK